MDVDEQQEEGKESESRGEEEDGQSLMMRTRKKEWKTDNPVS